MNYLAHIFLSGEDRRMQLGNFIADAVKGSAYNNYPADIRDGIMLHRAIDAYTDGHPAIRETVRSLKPYFGRYSAALLDIFFDHLLALRFSEFSHTTLKSFTRRFYWTMIRNRRYLPPRIKRFMWHFITTDRLGKYVSESGISESLGIMAGVGRLDIDVNEAVGYLSAHKGELWAVFRPFFVELQAICNGYISSTDRDEYLKNIRQSAGSE